MCYRRGDSQASCGRIYDRLCKHFGNRNVFLDNRSMPYGVQFPPFIEHEVSRCDAFLALIGPHWLATTEEPKGPPPDAQSLLPNRRLFRPGDYVRHEIELALGRMPAVRVVPVLVDGAKMPEERDLPKELWQLSYQ